MTVQQLFDHFTFAFSKITYFYINENDEDELFIRTKDGDFNCLKYYKFLDDYGECTITAWKYDYKDNSILIEFKY